MLLIVRSYDDKTEHLSICPRLYRAVARSENPGGGLVVMGGENVSPPLVEIGLTDLPKNGGGAKAPPVPCMQQPCLMSTTRNTHTFKKITFISLLFFSCWLDFSNGLIWAFGAPVACVLVVNSVMFMIAIRIARKSIQKRGQSSERTLALIKGTPYLLLCT